MHLHTKIEMDPIIIKQKSGGDTNHYTDGPTDGRTDGRLQVIPAFCHTGPSRTGPAAGVTSHSGPHAWSVRPPHNHGVVLTARQRNYGLDRPQRC